MNHKAREEWEKKQAEAEKLRKLNEVSVVIFLHLGRVIIELIILWV